jgi:integrase
MALPLLKPRIDEIYQSHENRRYREFLHSLSDDITFEDDNWYCEKRFKNVSHNRNHVSISFRHIPKQYQEMVKYFALIRLINGVSVYTVNSRTLNLGIFLRFLNGAKLSEINIFTASRFKEYLDNENYTEKTRYTIWTAAGKFLSVMNGYDGIPLNNPFYKNYYAFGGSLDYKYIPDHVAKQLDRAFTNESVPPHLRVVYWILRLIPSRISEILGMKIDCLKPFDGHWCLSIPTWKQNGGYKEPIIRIIHINDEGIGGYLLSLIHIQQKIALSYQGFVKKGKEDALFTHRQMTRYKDGRIRYRNVYWTLTYTQVRDNFKKICAEFNVRDKNGAIYNVTTHQFRHNGITDRLRAGFTLAQIAEMTGHHGSAMIYGSYAHLDLVPEGLIEPQKYWNGEQQCGDNPYVMFGGKILNMDALTESRLLRNLRSNRVPGGICLDVTHCKNDMWNCLDCSRFVPEKEQLPYFEKQAEIWREKAERFRGDAIMYANFTSIAGRFNKIIVKINEGFEESHE